MRRRDELASVSLPKGILGRDIAIVVAPLKDASSCSFRRVVTLTHRRKHAKPKTIRYCRRLDSHARRFQFRGDNGYATLLPNRSRRNARTTVLCCPWSNGDAAF